MTDSENPYSAPTKGAHPAASQHGSDRDKTIYRTLMVAHAVYWGLGFSSCLSAAYSIGIGGYAFVGSILFGICATIVAIYKGHLAHSRYLGLAYMSLVLMLIGPIILIGVLVNLNH